MSNKKYRIGDVLNGRVYAGVDYGFQSRSTYNKLKNDGELRVGSSAVRRIGQALNKAIDKVPGARGYIEGVAQEGQRQQAVKDRLLQRAGVDTSKPDATSRAIEGVSRATNVNRTIVASGAAVAQAAIEGKAGIDGLRVLPGAIQTQRGKDLSRLTNKVDGSVNYFAGVPAGSPATGRAVRAKPAVPIDATAANRGAKASFSNPVRPNDLQLKTRVQLALERNRQGGLSTANNKPVAPGRALPKGEILEVRKPQPRPSSTLNTNDGYINVNGVRTNQPSKVSGSNGSYTIRYSTPAQVPTTPKFTRHKWRTNDGIGEVESLSAYESNISDINPTIINTTRPKTGDVADLTRAEIRRQSGQAVDRVYERAQLGVQRSYDANPKVPGKKQIQELDQKEITAATQRVRGRVEKILKDKDEVRRNIDRQVRQNEPGASFDRNDNLSTAQRNRMGGEVRQAAGSSGLSKAEFDALPKAEQVRIRSSLERKLRNNSDYRRGAYQEGRIQSDSYGRSNSVPDKARGKYGYDDKTGLPNGYRNFGDDRLNQPPKIDGQTRDQGNKSYMDNDGRKQKAYSTEVSYENYKPGDYAQERQTPKRIQERLSLHQQRGILAPNRNAEAGGLSVRDERGGRYIGDTQNRNGKGQPVYLAQPDGVATFDPKQRIDPRSLPPAKDVRDKPSRIQASVIRRREVSQTVPQASDLYPIRPIDRVGNTGRNDNRVREAVKEANRGRSSYAASAQNHYAAEVLNKGSEWTVLKPDQVEDLREFTDLVGENLEQFTLNGKPLTAQDLKRINTRGLQSTDKLRARYDWQQQLADTNRANARFREQFGNVKQVTVGQKTWDTTSPSRDPDRFNADGSRRGVANNKPYIEDNRDPMDPGYSGYPDREWIDPEGKQNSRIRRIITGKRGGKKQQILDGRRAEYENYSLEDVGTTTGRMVPYTKEIGAGIPGFKLEHALNNSGIGRLPRNVQKALIEQLEETVSTTLERPIRDRNDVNRFMNHYLSVIKKTEPSVYQEITRTYQQEVREFIQAGLQPRNNPRTSGINEIPFEASGELRGVSSKTTGASARQTTRTPVTGRGTNQQLPVSSVEAERRIRARVQRRLP